MKRFFGQFDSSSRKFAAAVLMAAFLLSACSDPASTESSSPPEWPESLSVPIRAATFGMSESHLPGARRGYRNGVHQGFDFFNGLSGRPLAEDEPVIVIWAGEVVRIDHDYEEPARESLQFWAKLANAPGFTGNFAIDKLRGRQVWIRHEGGYTSRYAHLSAVHPELLLGDAVEQGQPIGLLGSSGLVPTEDQPEPAPHLHFELWSADGTSYFGQDRIPLETHRLVAKHFGPEALPRFAREAVATVESDRPVPDPYPPEQLPETSFQVNAPISVKAGRPFSIPITWENGEFHTEDFFALLEGQTLGIIDASNGAWILGATPHALDIDRVSLVVGGTDAFGQTLTGRQAIDVAAADSAPQPREVPQIIFDLYSEENRRREAQILGPVVMRSFEIREPLWNEPFNAPVDGDVVGGFGQRIYHAMLRPAHPATGISVVAESGQAVRASNSGHVALVEDLPIRGKTIALIHGGGVVSVYSYLADSSVQVGDSVRRGQRIGSIGQSGAAFRPMMFWEIYVAGIASDPTAWLGQTLPGRTDS